MIPCHLFQHKGSLTSSCSTGRPFLWCCHLSVLLPSYCGEVRDHIVCKVQLQQLVLARGVMACVLNTRLRIMYSIFFCKVWPECTIVCHGVKSLPYSDKGSLFMPMFTKCSALHLKVMVNHFCTSGQGDCYVTQMLLHRTLYQYFVLQMTKSTSKFYP